VALSGTHLTYLITYLLSWALDTGERREWEWEREGKRERRGSGGEVEVIYSSRTAGPPLRETGSCAEYR